MNIKDKIKLYEENISKKENIGYKKSQINKNNVRRKINHWNTINNDIIKKEGEKIETEKVKTEKVKMQKLEDEKVDENIIKKEKIKEKKNLKKEDSEDEYEFENGIINM